MSLTTFLIQSPITHPRKVICGLLLLTLFSAILFISHAQDSTTTFLTKGPPWTKLYQAEQLASAQEILTVGILPRSEEAGLFTAAGASHIASIDQALQPLATVTSSLPQVIATDYLAPGNIDLVVPDGLGAIKRIPFLDTTVIPPQITEAKAQQALQSPLLSDTFVSQDGQAIALRLPCLISGQTQKIQQKLQLATGNTSPKNPQLLFSGLSFARENFFREIQSNILPLMCTSLAGIVAISLLIVFPFRYTCTVILPVAGSTSFTLGLQTLLQLPAGIFSFTPPLTAACTSLLFSIWTIAILGCKLPKKGEQNRVVAQKMKSLLPQLWLISLASGCSILCLCFSSISHIRFLGCFTALGIFFAFITTVMAVPATCILLTPTWRSAEKSHNKTSKGLATLSKYTTQSTLPRKLAYICANHWLFTVPPHTFFLALGITGIMLTTFDTTPVQWYAKKHWVQTANQENMQRFAGIDQLNLVFTAPVGVERSLPEAQQWLTTTLKNTFDDAPSFYTALEKDIEQTTGHLNSAMELSSRLTGLWHQKMNALQLEDYIQINRWSIALDTLAHLDNEHFFFRPAVLVYLANLQKTLEHLPQVGKALTVADIAQSMHQNLFEGDPKYKRIPPTIGSVDQALAAFNQIRPTHYLSRLVNANATQTTLTLYLKNSSPNAIDKISQVASSYFKTTPPPLPMDYYWTGSAYGFKIWKEKVISSLCLWAAVGLVAACLIFSLARHSLIYGLSIFGVTGYLLICTYGICGLLGIHLSAFAMAAITILLPVTFSLTSMILHSASKTVTEHGCWHGNQKEPLAEASFPAIWGIAAVTFGCIPALFSAYNLLQTTAFMTISFMLTSGIVFFTLLPLLCNRLQTTLFKKELFAYHEAKEQAAVTAGKEDSINDNLPPLSPPADEAGKPELKDVFAPPKKTGSA